MKLLDVNEYAVSKLANRIMLLKHLVLEIAGIWPFMCYLLHVFTAKIFISSPEPLGSQGELIVYPSSQRLSVVRRRQPSVRPPFSKIFSSETTWPIKAKFYMEPPWEGGTKVFINGQGHMTKVAAMPIYGKNPSKIFFSRTGWLISSKPGM